ncbi:LysR substrate-binding domain-containing protein [Rhizobium johnstonii]|uniref:LysR family transcriptional regulator n=1 Tax=Rhizobium TaxID=379 RepID=UPI001030DEAB|nr:LysR family transcriptional regulator [Rhizobium leguminosarum]TBF43397.1 LysR family transcriptional regulator [Rhizobium leguminosarum]TBF46308.1 LysR family transcriptional regulator [Rhizobium leguminosarum]TBF47724.1 LysR family transcriptional regulator [Rhizobium leguminosarum]TBF65199.1 LysR family transcriptional regulator [Rhizobium leguminosarum]TBF67268.1 LysR family transcriptional regulator [Rhizobium leguminosarum]
MDVDALRLLVRIAQLRSISAAARDLGLTPAGASARLAALERKLSARLLHRTTRQATLTEDGLAFLPHAEQVVHAAESALAALGREQASPRGTLRVAAPASFARMHIVPGLPQFCRRYSELALDMRISDSIVDLVEGAFDVAVRYTELSDSSFVARRLAPDNRVLVASPDYIEQRGRPNTPDDLAKHSCLVVGTLDLWTFRGKDGEVIEQHVSPSLRINDGSAVRDAASAGLGIALMATWCASDEIRSGALVPALPEYPLVSTQTLWALYPSSRELAPKVRVFIDWLLDRFGHQPYWDQGLENILDSNR